MTTNESIEKTIECPVCDSEVSVNKIAGFGLSHNQLSVLRQYAKEGILGQVINIAEIMLRKLEPEKANIEFQINDALTKLSTTARQLLDQYNKQQSAFIEKLSQTGENEKDEIIEKGKEEAMRMTESLRNEIFNTTKSIERIEQRCSELNQNIQHIKCKISGNGMGNLTEKIVIKDLSSAIKTDDFSDEMASKHGTDIIGTVMDNGIDCGRITVSVKNTLKWENRCILN